MKVLGIVGSTRKNGNTEVLVREVLDAAAKEGAETEMIFLSEFQLSPCNACHVCDRTTPPICTIKDDVEKLTELMVKADGFIIGSPVYYGGVTSEVKIFIDRIGYLNRARERATFRNKIGGAVAVARRAGLMGTLDQLTGFLSSMNMILPGSVRVRGIGNKRGEVRKDEEGMREARMLGSEMVTLMRLTKELR
jgi:multimeric flavodoxin WrbA